MNELAIMTIVKKALITGILVAGPILAISLVVGLIISIFQAATQIQEQTLTFLPKVLAIILLLVVGGPWMLNKLVMFTSEMFQSISTIVK
ncbi:flagellar biosynthesis protein FliQ [Clostridium sp.]|uniref:flagellar biosynthesis protein FliQ n=1 Tax=Clostridium sp. TaxID=1506 RepID=UPI00261C63F7|nr:flagellar biosynthesis protein FliQ [Clostridium sp.]